MSRRPLIITDCDEVLLHMVVPFRDWLGEKHGVAFDVARGDFSKALKYMDSGALLEAKDIWRLLHSFFDSEMYRQTPIPGAVRAIHDLRAQADVVVLTNLMDHRQESRTRQLAEFGLNLRVFTNQGPKGPALKAIIEEYNPSRAVFIDDLAEHHGSVAELTPKVGRLHLCGEPLLAPHIACAHEAGHAHARIDDWGTATPWLLGWLNGDNND